MILRGARRPTSLAAAFALTAVACGGDDPAGTDGAPASPVLATTSIWADITSRTLCDIDVPALIPTGADPHTFEPSLRDRERLEAAEIVIANGGGLEGSLGDLLATVATGDTNLVEVAPFVDTIVVDHGEDDDEHTDDEHTDDGQEDAGEESHDDDGAGDDGEAGDDGHGHGLEIDPHLWQDPRRDVSALDVIVSAAAAIDVDDCADAYLAELLALDEEIEGLLATVPPGDRVMVTSHDSLAYFADRYDLEVVGTVIPSTSTLAETNAADLADLAAIIEDRGVRAIFTEELESSADADALARRLGVTVVPLVTDALTDEPGSDTYVEMMRTNATRVARALAP